MTSLSRPAKATTLPQRENHLRHSARERLPKQRDGSRGSACSAAVADVAERAGVEGDCVEDPSAPGAGRRLADEADSYRRARRSEDPDELPAPAAVGRVEGDRLADTRQAQRGCLLR